MKKYFKILLVLVMFIAMPVFALSQDLFRADDSVTVKEKLDGSGFVAGNMVDVDSTVDGILFAAGNEVNVKGNSDYAFGGAFVQLDGIEPTHAMWLALKTQ